MVPLNNLEIAKANVERAEAACDARRYEIARQCAVDAITADPNSGDGYASLGRACLGLQEFEEAEKHFREAYSIDPTDAWYLIGLAISLRCQKNASEVAFVKLFLQTLMMATAAQGSMVCGERHRVHQAFGVIRGR